MYNDSKLNCDGITKIYRLENGRGYPNNPDVFSIKITFRCQKCGNSAEMTIQGIEYIREFQHYIAEKILENQVMREARLLQAMETIASGVKYNGMTINIQDSVVQRSNIGTDKEELEGFPWQKKK